MADAANQPSDTRTAGTSPAVRVAFVGAGRVGCSLGRYLAENGTEVVGYASATPAHARDAAAFAGGRAFASAAEAAAASDAVLLTVPDGAIADAWAHLAAAAREGKVDLAGKVVGHCSGALPSSVLAGAEELGARPCSAHPLYAVSSRWDSWSELGRAWFTLEGDARACELLGALLRAAGNPVATIAPSQKVRYHAAAVIASNLVVGLYDMAAAELGRCGFDHADAERALAPLFLGNAEHVAEDGPAAALTGPASRGDMATVRAHLDCLEGDARDAYEAITRDLVSLAARRDVGSR